MTSVAGIKPKALASFLARHAAPILLVACALAVRLYRIDAQSLWFDEGWSVHLARASLAEALRQIASEGHTHPPGYYLLLMAWVRVLGDGVVAVRALSAVIGALTVLVVYHAGRTLADRGTGLVAGTLLALAPAHLVYSQEVRMYALLCAVLAGLLPLYYRYGRRRAGWRWRDWAALAGLEIAACYTHLFAFLFLAALAAWLVVTLAIEGRAGRRALLPWLGSQALVAVAFIPWLGPALARAEGHSALGAVAPTAGAFLQETWTFLLGGHIALLGRAPTFALAARICLLVTVFVALWLLAFVRGRRDVPLFLLVQGVGPCALVFLLMQARPGYHPRYVLAALVPLVLLVAAGLTTLARRGGWRRGMALVVAATWLASTGLATRALASDRYYDRDDARGAVAYLDGRLTPGAPILMDVDDWALRYYLDPRGRAPLYLDGDRASAEVAADVAAALAGREEAALVTWYAGETDRRDLLPYLLERAGRLVAREHAGGYTLWVYDLESEVAPPLTLAPEADFGPLRLVAATVDPVAPADEGIPVALDWRIEEPLRAAYKVSVKLVDAGGHQVAQEDWSLRASAGRSSGEWLPGEQVSGYAVLAVPPGTPPGRYALSVGVYAEDNPSGLDLRDAAGNPAGKAYVLPEITLAEASEANVRPVEREALGLHPLDAPHEAVPGLVVMAHTALPARVDTGLTLSVRVEWRCTAAPLPDYAPVLRLSRAGRVLAERAAPPAYGAYPTGRWRSGESVLDWRALDVPVDAQAGAADLELVVADGPPLRLGSVRIEAVPHTFVAPSPQVATSLPLGPFATLVGYDLPPEGVRPGEPVSLTLHWRADETPAEEYVVFTHLLDGSGRLVAQHDGPPAAGGRPTTGWVTGEYIRDEHLLEWVDPDYRGPVTIEVGLYEPATGRRLPAPDGDSRLMLATGIMAP